MTRYIGGPWGGAWRPATLARLTRQASSIQPLKHWRMVRPVGSLFRVEIATASVAAVDSWPATRASLARIAQAAGRKQIASGLSLDRPGCAIWADLIPPSAADDTLVPGRELASAHTGETSIVQVHRQAFDVVRFLPAPNCEYFLEFTLKVDDFETWMLAFDQEGAAQRATDGLIDEVIARGVNDPSLVHLVFLVSELETARRGVRSPARTCFSPAAAVPRQPPFEFFRWTGAGAAG